MSQLFLFIIQNLYFNFKKKKKINHTSCKKKQKQKQFKKKKALNSFEFESINQKVCSWDCFEGRHRQEWFWRLACFRFARLFRCSARRWKDVTFFLYLMVSEVKTIIIHNRLYNENIQQSINQSQQVAKRK